MMQRDAIISACGRYRYRLTRAFGSGGRSVVFIGVNPSTADAAIDDPTVRKWMGFAGVWGFDEIVVVNLFAFRSTDVRGLATATAPIGADNNAYITAALRVASLVVPCWGRASKIPKPLRGRIQEVRNMLTKVSTDVMCLGETACGNPKHPLMLPYSTPLQHWPAWRRPGAEA